jgi:4a-hydroxytetrahydrobiopterin dehydratase
MSEQGWREFLAAEGVDDWVVLHGGATAIFTVRSLAEAAQLAEAISHVPGLDDSGVLLTMSGEGLSVRLTRGVFRLEARHLDLAPAISARCP